MKRFVGLCLSLILLITVFVGSAFAAEKSTAGKEGAEFKACKLEWKVGKADLDWNQSQEWVKSLGGDWRMPTKVELIALFAEKGQKSPIGQDFAWAEMRDAHSAWYFSFYFQEIRWSYLDDHSKYGRAVAVRPAK